MKIPPERIPPKRILMVKLSAIGDVIHTLPALNALRRAYPAAHIAWVVEAAAAPLLEGHPSLDRVIVSRRKDWVRSLLGRSSSFRDRRRALLEMRRFVRDLRETRYDLVIDFQQLLKSGLLVGLARGRRKAGYGSGLDHIEGSHWFLNHRFPLRSMDRHALPRSLDILNGLGIPTPVVEYRLPVGDAALEKVNGLLARHGATGTGPLVAVNPMAKWATKLWSSEKFARLADRLAARYGARVVFTGAGADRGVISGILGRMGSLAANLAGETSLPELAALFRTADLAVTTDTGPMHLAAAVGTPVVALFGPTAPWRTGPFGPGHRVVRAGLPCAPCFRRRCGTTACMAAIDVPDVLTAVETLLPKDRRRRPRSAEDDADTDPETPVREAPSHGRKAHPEDDG